MTVHTFGKAVKRAAILALGASLAALGAGAAPSLVVVRQEEHLELNREKFKAILDIHRRHPGSCDEFWMSDRDFFRTFADLTNHLAATEACRADFERAGELDCVTLLNCSIGETDELKVRIRRPVGAKAVWMQPGKAPVALKYEAGEKEGLLTVPSIAGWQIGTVFFRK